MKMEDNLEAKPERCPLIGYCIAPFGDEAICVGEKGDYRKCPVYVEHAEREDQHHNPSIINVEAN